MCVNECTGDLKYYYSVGRKVCRKICRDDYPYLKIVNGHFEC